MIKDKNFLKAGSLSMIYRISFAAFGLINFMLLIRILDKNEFGIWVLYISVTAIIESVRKAFIYNPLVKYLASSSESDYNVIVNSSLYLNILSSVIIAIVLILIAPVLINIWNAPVFDHLLLIYIIINFLYIIIIHFTSIAETFLDFTITLAGFLAQKIVFFVFILFFFYSDSPLSIKELIFYQLISVFIGAFLTIMMSKKYFTKLTKINVRWLVIHFNFGKYTFGTNISSMIFKNTDSWMLGSLISKASVAVYNPAIRMAALFEIPLGAISSVIFPKVAKESAADKDSPKRMYEKSVGFMLFLLIPPIIIMMIFAEEIILILAGNDYLSATPILQVTLLYGLILPFNRQFGVIMNATGKAHLNFYVLIFGTVINIVLNYFLISVYGTIGAAYATLFSYLLILIICEFILYRSIDVRFINIIRYLFDFYKRSFKMIFNIKHNYSGIN